MPRYDFKCDTCGEVTEVYISSWREATANDQSHPCPWCKIGKMIKQPVAPSFIIKGFNAANGYGK
jgi:putative FmdB family regulatory protein